MNISKSPSGFPGKVFIGIILAIFSASLSFAQILMSGGNYSQNFDSLATSGSSNPWADNSTLPGWYASINTQSATSYRAGAGTIGTGGIYSFGTNGVNPLSDRALGSVASAGNVYTFGVRFVNDTAFAQTNITISYTGEQWRSANTVTNTLAFSYQISYVPLTNAGAINSWTAFNALDFNSPNAGGGSAVDGNATANRQSFTNILPGVAVQPGQEIFLRWRDVDDAGSDAGIAIDDLTVSFDSIAAVPSSPPVITSQPQNQATAENGFAKFFVTASGIPGPNYQWQLNGTNLPDETGDTLTLNNVTTNQPGNYSVIVTNVAGGTNSAAAKLFVTPVSFATTNGEIRYLTYNVNGNGVADWSTNSLQVQAIGREIVYLNPDIITFNEIPYTNTWQMTNWRQVYFPGFFMATNSGTDGFIRNVVASRFPIIRSQSWLNNSSLTNFGYNGRYPRDLFEAQIAVPNWPLPLHVFVAHLKATTGSTPGEKQDAADERAAQGNSISNFLVNVFLAGTNGSHPYILSGDLNEDVFYPDTDYASRQPIQRLTSAPTGLFLTTPINPFSNSPSNAFTESIRGPLDTRFDYILPCAMLLSNIAGMEVFRTDLLTNLPPDLNSNDDKTASDHLPVLMVFRNPFDTPFQLLSVGVTNQNLTLTWESQNNRSFNIEASTDLVSWTPFATNIFTTTNTFTFTTNVSGGEKFFRIYRAP